MLSTPCTIFRPMQVAYHSVLNLYQLRHTRQLEGDLTSVTELMDMIGHDVRLMCWRVSRKSHARTEVKIMTEIDSR
jgi:hypothetical protein